MHPKISIVTPNYNCETFLERTIVSVVSQDYPNLEYILVDGASTDGSMRIVERYRAHFAHVVCEPDQGHADALNKGLTLATGEVMGWINSDDLLLPGSLARVGAAFQAMPDVQWLTGIPSMCDEADTLRSFSRRLWSWQRMLAGDYRHIQQESTFWRSSLWRDCGARLDTRLALANDFELWLRFFERAALYTLEAPLGCFRARAGQRSIASADDYEAECLAALSAFRNRLPLAALARHLHLVPQAQLDTPGARPTNLPEALFEFDPPPISLDADGRPVPAIHPIPALLMDIRPDHRVTEDLAFDGNQRVLWRGGPDVAGHELAGFEIDLVPFAPAARVIDPLGPTSPPMVCLAGPLSVSDWGGGRHALQIRFKSGVVTCDLQLPDAGQRYRLKVVLEPARHTVLLDGQIVLSGDNPGPQVMQSPYCVVGGGFAQRFWLGAVQRLAVALRPAGAAAGAPVRTWELAHEEGRYELPRQHRSAVVRPATPATALHEPTSSLAPWRNRHRGERCFIMGNGPSLNKMDLSLLEGETVFACNGAFLLFDRVAWRPTYYTCVDTRVIRDRAGDIAAMLDAEPGITAFFPSVVHLHDGSGQEFAGRDVIPPGPNRHYFREVGNRPSHHVETMFSLDADDYVVQPYTVAITMLQLAMHMGFGEIYLIGCDTSYKVQETVRQEGREIGGVGLLLTSTQDDDDNHFDPSYFGQGRQWHNPQVAQMLEHYRWARLASRRRGVRVFNATVGGKLEVFERVDFDTLFPRPAGALRLPPPPVPPRPPLLSIAIPAYDRAGPLLKALETFAAQVLQGQFEHEVEIVVSDDCTPGDRLRPVREFVQQHSSFMRWRRYERNIGLEKNLLACADDCSGEYLWLFGDDDFLETDDALAKVLDVLREGRHDMLVLNRSRRSVDLQTLITPNWMGLDPALRRDYAGLRDFCLDFGYLSVVGFISVNVFRRRHYQRVDAQRYHGTMYPQLGAMVEAFHSRPLLLLGEPLVCHRTQTAEEKRAALGQKAGEADFMADANRRNAVFFSHPHVAMLDDLMTLGAFGADDVLRIRENTVIDGLLADFLIDCVRANHELPFDRAGAGTQEQWQRTEAFFARLPLDRERRARIDEILSWHQPVPLTLTISAVSPSFNQAEYLPDCLRTVRDQTYPAIEHLVFDPGSRDDSRAIAASYPHATLVAEPDEGQSDALNKGFVRVRGDIICWLNSDDQLADDQVFQRVVERFQRPDAPDIVYGRGIYIDERGDKLRDAYINKDPGTLHWRFAQEDGIMQPALFMRRSVVERVGPLRNDLHYSMDYEYWIRCVKAGIRFAFIDHDLAVARYHIDNKTYGQRGNSYTEVCRVMKEHFAYVSHLWLRRWAEFIADGHDGVLAHAQNAGVRDTAVLEQHYLALMREHNGDLRARLALWRGAGRRGAGETLAEMQRLGLMPGQDPLLQPADWRKDAGEPQAGPNASPTLKVGRAFQASGPDRWTYHSTPQAYDRMWSRIFWSRPPSTYLGCVAVTSSVDLSVRVTLGRQGGTPWEGSGNSVNLVAGQRQVLTVRQPFKQRHLGLRIQLEVLDDASASNAEAELTVHHAFVCETLPALQARLGPDTLRIHTANQLLTLGDAPAALPLYLLLRKLRGWDMYDLNAQAAARQMGLDLAANTTDQLSRLLG